MVPAADENGCITLLFPEIDSTRVGGPLLLMDTLLLLLGTTAVVRLELYTLVGEGYGGLIQTPLLEIVW